jgi:hypothetical protein
MGALPWQLTQSHCHALTKLFNLVDRAPRPTAIIAQAEVTMPELAPAE